MYSCLSQICLCPMQTMDFICNSKQWSKFCSDYELDPLKSVFTRHSSENYQTQWDKPSCRAKVLTCFPIIIQAGKCSVLPPPLRYMVGLIVPILLINRDEKASVVFLNSQRSHP